MFIKNTKLKLKQYQVNKKKIKQHYITKSYLTTSDQYLLVAIVTNFKTISHTFLQETVWLILLKP